MSYTATVIKSTENYQRFRVIKVHCIRKYLLRNLCLLMKAVRIHIDTLDVTGIVQLCNLGSTCRIIQTREYYHPYMRICVYDGTIEIICTVEFT